MNVIDISPAFCLPWRARSFIVSEVKGGLCARCRRDVAVPTHIGRRLAVCIYCGLDSGDLVAVEIEPDILLPPQDEVAK